MPATPLDDGTAIVLAELGHVIAEYWRDVDVNGGQEAPSFFTETGEFWVGSDKVFRGRDGVTEFYRYRAERGMRTTRHLVSNLRMVSHDDASTKVQFAVVNFASDGAPPITGLESPSLISDVTMEFRRSADGSWLIQSLRGQPIFIGNEPYTVSVLVDGKH